MHLPRVTLQLAVWLLVLTAACFCAHVDVSNPHVVIRREGGRVLRVSVDIRPRNMHAAAAAAADDGGYAAVSGPFQLCLFSNTTSCFCEDTLRDVATTAATAAVVVMPVWLPLPLECLPQDPSVPFWFHVRVYPHGTHLPLTLPLALPLP